MLKVPFIWLIFYSFFLPYSPVEKCPSTAHWVLFDRISLYWVMAWLFSFPSLESSCHHMRNQEANPIWTWWACPWLTPFTKDWIFLVCDEFFLDTDPPIRFFPTSFFAPMMLGCSVVSPLHVDREVFYFKHWTLLLWSDVWFFLFFLRECDRATLPKVIYFVCGHQKLRIHYFKLDGLLPKYFRYSPGQDFA